MASTSSFLSSSLANNCLLGESDLLSYLKATLFPSVTIKDVLCKASPGSFPSTVPRDLENTEWISTSFFEKRKGEGVEGGKLSRVAGTSGLEIT